MPHSPSLIHDCRYDFVVHSITKYFIFNVERVPFMRRTYSRGVFRISRIKSSNKMPRSFMSLFNIETLSVFRRTCLDYNCLNKLPRSLGRTEFFAKRINIDLLRTGRVSSILHVITSPRSFTNWIWNWKNFACRDNFSFWLSSNFSFWLSSNFRTQFSSPLVLQ